MKFLPRSTLAYHESAPQKKLSNLSLRSLSLFSEATSKYRGGCSLVNPDIEALEFYALNHYYAVVSKKFTKNEPLPQWATGLCVAYSGCLTHQAERLMHYMFSIITREARHLRPMSATLVKKVGEIAGKEMLDFVNEIRGVPESSAVDKYMKSPPKVKSGPYVRAIEYCFDHGNWSSSFGGKPWGQIARTLGDFLYGKTSLEMMVDTAYTLAHNNGPMFNKGMMYSMYSGSFKNILDVQRGGMIPELIKNKSKYPYIKSLSIPALEQMNLIAYENMESEFKDDVDWQKVMDLGALGSYAHLIKKPESPAEQFFSEAAKVQPKPAPSKVNVPQFTLFNGKAAKHVGTFQVTKDEKVEIMERI